MWIDLFASLRLWKDALCNLQRTLYRPRRMAIGCKNDTPLALVQVAANSEDDSMLPTKHLDARNGIHRTER